MPQHMTNTAPATEAADAAPRTIHVTSTACAATFYRNKAQIQRRAPVSFAAAYEEVQVYVPLPKVLDKDSLQVQVDAALADKVVLKGVSFDTVDADCLQDDGFVVLDGEPASVGAGKAQDDDSSALRLRQLDDHIKALEKKIALNAAAQEDAEARFAFVNDMSDKSLSTQGGSGFHGSPALWEAGTWEAQLAAVSEARLRHKREVRELEKAKEKLQEDLQKARQERAVFASGSRAAEEEKRVAVAVVVLRVLQATGEGCLFVSYTVPHGSWSATYDVHLSTSTNEVTVFYNAEVSLWAGEDLKEVELTLSSAAPRSNGVQPTLSAWRCGIKVPPPPPPQNASSGDEVDDCSYEDECCDVVECCATSMMADEAEVGVTQMDAAPMMAVAQAGVQEGATGVANFDIPSAQTIMANGEPVRVPLAVIKMPATIAYVAVPSRQEAAYARATVCNDSEYLMLDGSASIFTDGDFVCKTHLARAAVGDKLDIDFGADSHVCVKRVMLNAKRRPQRGGKCITHTAYKTTIENKKKVAIGVKVRERVPMSSEEKLVVRLLEPSSVATDEQKRRLETDGEVEVDLHVGAGKTVTFPFSYEVEAPAGQTVYGLEP